MPNGCEMGCANEPDDPAASAGSRGGERAADAIDRAASRLGLLASELRGGRATRREVDDAIGALEAELTRILGPRPPAGRGTGGKAKILRYLLDHMGEVVHGEELAGISGIGEWARRVRELRVENGYDIEELGRSRYRLRSAEPDSIRADQWRLANPGFRSWRARGPDSGG